jgi:hypothetical protein
MVRRLVFMVQKMQKRAKPRMASSVEISSMFVFICFSGVARGGKKCLAGGEIFIYTGLCT